MFFYSVVPHKSMRTWKKINDNRSSMYLQSNDGGEWSDNCILQYTQFAPKQQYSAKEKELSIFNYSFKCYQIFSKASTLKSPWQMMPYLHLILLVILNGDWGRMWVVANKSFKYYFKNYLTTTSAGPSFCVECQISE